MQNLTTFRLLGLKIAVPFILSLLILVGCACENPMTDDETFVATNITLTGTIVSNAETRFFEQTNFVFSNQSNAIIHYTTNINSFTNLFLGFNFLSNNLSNASLSSNVLGLMTTNYSAVTNINVNNSNSYILIETNAEFQFSNNGEVVSITNAVTNVEVLANAVTNTEWMNWDFSGANLSYLILSNYNFSGADLENADLKNADIRDANLTNANLRDADLSNAAFVSFKGTFGETGTGDGQFQLPIDLAVDDRFIYVVDENRHNVQLFDKSNWTYVTHFGSEGTNNGEFERPRSIALSDTSIYILDSVRHDVQVFNKTSRTYVTRFGSEGTNNGELNTPNSIAVDNTHIYVLDVDNSFNVNLFNINNYTFFTNFGEFGVSAGQFVSSTLTKINLDSNYIYVAEEARLQLFNKTNRSYVNHIGNPTSRGFGNGDFIIANGISFDDSFIYIGDGSIGGNSVQNSVKIFNKNTLAFVSKFGGDGLGEGQFQNIQSVAVNNGFIYVLDSMGYNVEIFFSSLAGVRF